MPGYQLRLFRNNTPDFESALRASERDGIGRDHKFSTNSHSVSLLHHTFLSPALLSCASTDFCRAQISIEHGGVHPSSATSV